MTCSNDTKEDAIEKIYTDITLLCGRKVQNRLVKVAMYEHLASMFGGPPNKHHYKLYSNWSKFNWGIIITGNVQVSAAHLGLGRDLIVPHTLSEENVHPFRKLAECIHGNRSEDTESLKPLAIMQLNHAGRQSSNFLGGRYPFVPPLAPSAIPVSSKNPGLVSWIIHNLLFQTPRAMSLNDIEHVISEFVRGAELALRAGFDGVQLHVAHGYLLAQFLSSKVNKRDDEYGSNPLHLLHRLVTAIRAVTPKDFALGVKFNTSDYSALEESASKAEQEKHALDHLRILASWGTLDFIEISGGDYENPEFMMSGSKSSRQAFFASFSAKAVQTLESGSAPTPPFIILTGGLKSPGHLITAISSRHAHLLGIGRASVICPDLPIRFKRRVADTVDTPVGEDFAPFQPEPDLHLDFVQQWPWSWIWRFVPKINLIGAGIGIAWYVVAIRRLANYEVNGTQSYVPEYELGGLGAVLMMWIWQDAPEIQAKGGKLSMIALAVSVVSLGIWWRMAI
ncbi:nadph dehydrogenase [Moniliophthora roreri MCA 2997]|uniref:Nadph dehydrogenase n=2 Tax=Moniliophthora roreri TaxID=221103 RepID=V2XIW8_MONRO|nr:nadph dehydrogenase [Moniliophthora roreri MCA 2997]KAI3614111.1 nadph dehydrogenase [Moniliophthora roreri]